MKMGIFGGTIEEIESEILREMTSVMGGGSVQKHPVHIFSDAEVHGLKNENDYLKNALRALHAENEQLRKQLKEARLGIKNLREKRQKDIRVHVRREKKLANRIHKLRARIPRYAAQKLAIEDIKAAVDGVSVSAKKPLKSELRKRLISVQKSVESV